MYNTGFHIEDSVKSMKMRTHLKVMIQCPQNNLHGIFTSKLQYHSKHSVIPSTGQHTEHSGCLVFSRFKLQLN